MDSYDKPLVWLHGEVKTPPFSKSARLEAGFLKYTTPLKKNMRIYCNPTLCDYFITLLLVRGGETVPIYGTFSICNISVSGRRGGGQLYKIYGA